MKDFWKRFFKALIEDERVLKYGVEFLKVVLLAAIAALGLTACGTTRATISRPAEGTQTTITITTNNPITTNVDPTLEPVINLKP